MRELDSKHLLHPLPAVNTDSSFPIYFSPNDFAIQDIARNEILIYNKSCSLVVLDKKILEDGATELIVKKVSLDIKRTIEPVDLNQKIFLYYLENKDIPLVTCLARSGCGKTFLSLYAALAAIKSKLYQQVIIIKPLVGVSNNKFLGTLPGDLGEKIAPFLDSFYDVAISLKELRNFEDYLDKGLITFQPLDFMRGRNLANTMIIMDEVQNLSRHSLLTIGTRVSMGSKLVLLGDPNQKDMNTDLDINDFVTNQLFTDSPFSAHVELTKRCRSPITELFESILT